MKIGPTIKKEESGSRFRIDIDVLVILTEKFKYIYTRVLKGHCWPSLARLSA